MPSGSAWSGRRGRRHHVLAHLSDLHVRGDDSRVDGVVDTRHQVERALSILSRWGDAVDAWVFSGDLSDDGSAASYAWLTERVGSAARILASCFSVACLPEPFRRSGGPAAAPSSSVALARLSAASSE